VIGYLAAHSYEGAGQAFGCGQPFRIASSLVSMNLLGRRSGIATRSIAEGSKSAGSVAASAGVIVVTVIGMGGFSEQLGSPVSLGPPRLEVDRVHVAEVRVERGVSALAAFSTRLLVALVPAKELPPKVVDAFLPMDAGARRRAPEERVFVYEVAVEQKQWVLSMMTSHLGIVNNQNCALG